MKFKQYIKRINSFTLLYIILTVTIVSNKINKFYRNKKFNRNGSVMVISAFHNKNWLKAHLLPLIKSDVKKVYLVCDDEVVPMDKILYIYPKGILRFLFPRSFSKLLLSIKFSIKYKPDLIIGYHMFPNAIIANFIGSIIDRPSCFQLTSGELQIVGGGWLSENPVAAGLGRPNRIIESKVYMLVKLFDLIVVRGENAKYFIRKIGYKNNIEVITGCVSFDVTEKKVTLRDIDIIYVGRLVEVKQVDILLEIVNKLKYKWPVINVVILGDGPLRSELVSVSQRLGIGNNVKFYGRVSCVEKFLKRSKIFVLTSEDEGMSIAMIEAMACGVVPVVHDVGDLSNIVHNRISGFLVEKNNIGKFVKIIDRLLLDNHLRETMADKSRSITIEKCGIEAISHVWNKVIQKVCS